MTEKQEWEKHECDKMPNHHLTWMMILIVKAPHRAHRDQILTKKGELYGQVSWKRFNCRWNPESVRWEHCHDGITLDPPRCEFCGVSLT